MQEISIGMFIVKHIIMGGIRLSSRDGTKLDLKVKGYIILMVYSLEVCWVYWNI